MVPTACTLARRHACMLVNIHACKNHACMYAPTPHKTLQHTRTERRVGGTYPCSSNLEYLSVADLNISARHSHSRLSTTTLPDASRFTSLKPKP